MALQDYLDLIPPPNSIQPNFMAWMEANLQVIVDTQDVCNSLVAAFNLDSAEGNQLDIIGEILNVSRIVDFQPGGGQNPTLNDYSYRIVLKAKILKNIWKGTVDEIYDFWSFFFPENPILIQDNQDMTMSILVINVPEDTTGAIYFGYDLETDTIAGYDVGYWEGFQSVSRDLIEYGYFTPKPAGVQVSYSFMEEPAFAYDLDLPYMKGYDEGYWPNFS